MCTPPRESADGLSDEHLAWMCVRCLDNLIPDDQVGKAMRWLGYIQGVLVSNKRFTLDDVKAHSRTSPE